MMSEGGEQELPLSAYERYIKEAKEADPGCDMSDSEFERMKEELRKGEGNGTKEGGETG